MPDIRFVISDFGGVLTTPLVEVFLAFQNDVGISSEGLGDAMAQLAMQDGDHPLFQLERGRISEREFLAKLERELERELDRPVPLHTFRDTYFGVLKPNKPMIEAMRSLKEMGYRMGLLTNNVREWEELWRSMLPVDEIFEEIVDSAFVNMRKPEPEIYELTLERLGAEAPECLFVDDTQVNCEAARDMGFRVVQFQDNAQTIAEISAALEIELPPR